MKTIILLFIIIIAFSSCNDVQQYKAVDTKTNTVSVVTFSSSIHLNKVVFREGDSVWVAEDGGITPIDSNTKKMMIIERL